MRAKKLLPDLIEALRLRYWRCGDGSVGTHLEQKRNYWTNLITSD